MYNKMKTKSTSKPLHFETRSTPRFGRGAYSDENAPRAVKDSPFYWWFMFLRINPDYVATENKNGKGPCSKLYKNFGNVSNTDFKTWWRNHAHLFAEERSSYRLQVANNSAELAPFESKEAINVVVPLSWSQKSLKKSFSLLLNKHIPKGERGPKLVTDSAAYGLGRRWNVSAMETAYKIYTLRQNFSERGATKSLKAQHKGKVSAKFKVAWADIALKANVIVANKDADRTERGNDEIRRLLTILANRHYKRALGFISAAATNRFPSQE